eukprot:415641_1
MLLFNFMAIGKYRNILMSIINYICILVLFMKRMNCYETFIANTALLDIYNTNQNGASVSILSNTGVSVSVDTINNEWDMIIYSQIGAGLMVDMNNLWGFHSTKVSTIKLEIESNDQVSSSDRDLIVSFSVNSAQYITTMIELDNSKHDWIYPGFDQQTIPTTSLGTGDVLNLINQNNGRERICKAMNNICSSCCSNMIQMDNNPDQFPLIFIFTNDPINNFMWFEFTNPTWPDAQAQKCGFNTAFD